MSSVDNYFGSAFDAFGIHRLLVASNSVAVFNVLAQNFPTYDQAFILVNSPYYGGSGGSIPVASLHADSKEIAIHELGHSFVSLIDEYYAGDVFANEGINMTQQTDPSLVKWKNWMGDNGIGIYQHCCGGNSAMWYRPHQSCKMRFLNNPFCSVCIEGTIERIHTLLSPISEFSPANTGPLNAEDSISFFINLIRPIPNTLAVEWQLNGTVIDSLSESLVLKAEDLNSGLNQLQFSVHDTTSLLRVDNHQSIHIHTVIWSIDSTMSTSIDDISEHHIKLSLWPNPAEDVLYIELDEELGAGFEVAVVDISGKQLRTASFSHTTDPVAFSLSGIPVGTYFILISSEDGWSISEKIIRR